MDIFNLSAETVGGWIVCAIFLGLMLYLVYSDGLQWLRRYRRGQASFRLLQTAGLGLSAVGVIWFFAWIITDGLIPNGLYGLCIGLTGVVASAFIQSRT